MANDLESGPEKSTGSADDQRDQEFEVSDSTVTKQELEDHLVDWDGPDDPQNPMNWSTARRLVQVVLASVFVLTA